MSPALLRWRNTPVRPLLPEKALNISMFGIGTGFAMYTDVLLVVAWFSFTAAVVEQG
jgi:hypothetical protein